MANPTTFISKRQIIYAALVYFWMKSGKNFRAPPSRNIKHQVHELPMGLFIAYFPTWLKFHELLRLGGYIHPFDFISAVYDDDMTISDRYQVEEADYEAKFGGLKDFEAPFALLSPAMQEGSALSGPFLPLKWTLGEVHHHMGLGSIWTIGLPLMPCDALSLRSYRLYAYPKHWQSELEAKSPYPLNETSFSASNTAPIREDVILRHWASLGSDIDCRHGIVAYHIGIRLGMPGGKVNPGWTTHLHGKDGLLCKRYGCHDLSKTQTGPETVASKLQDPEIRAENVDEVENLLCTEFCTSYRPQLRFGKLVDLIEVDSADKVLWNPETVKHDSFLARTANGISDDTPATVSTPGEPKAKPTVKSYRTSQKGSEETSKLIERLKKELKESKTTITSQAQAILELRLNRDALRIENAELGKQVDVFNTRLDADAANNFLGENPDAYTISQMRARLRDSLSDQRRTRAENEALRDEVEKLSADVERAKAPAAVLERMRQERQLLEAELEESRDAWVKSHESLRTMENAVGTSLEALFYKQELKTARQKMRQQEDLVIELAAARQENKGLQRELDELNEKHAESGFEPLEHGHIPMKRAAEDVLYHLGATTPKRMKTSKDNHLPLVGLDANKACELAGNVNYEVLRVAARGGLLHHEHFDIGPNGTLGLTEFGIQKAVISEKFRSHLESYEDWRTKQNQELTADARKLMEKGGFWTHGHESLLPLKHLLESNQDATPGDLVHCISVVYEDTRKMLTTLQDRARKLKDSPRAVLSNENLTDITRPIKALFSSYKDGMLSPSVAFKIANLLPGRPRIQLAENLTGLVRNYLRLADFSEKVARNAKVPLEFVPSTAANEELARSLASLGELSGEIGSLLAELDEEV